MAAVQTAYANGAATAYMRALPGVTVPLAKTGVKHLHHIAVGYDISVYFEANGHGTVLFSDKATSAILAAQAAAAAAADAKAERAAERLLLTRQLVNQAVGDAISDLLLVEAVLAVRGWSVAEWDGMYADLPSRQSKLPVADRGALTTTDDETRLVAPAALQSALDALMAAVPQGRRFAPSARGRRPRVRRGGDPGRRRRAGAQDGAGGARARGRRGREADRRVATYNTVFHTLL